MARLRAEAKRDGIVEFVVISLTEPTDLATSLASNTPGLVWLDESEVLDAWLQQQAWADAARQESPRTGELAERP